MITYIIIILNTLIYKAYMKYTTYHSLIAGVVHNPISAIWSYHYNLSSKISQIHLTIIASSRIYFN